MAQIFGYTPAEMVQLPSVLDVVAEEERSRVAANIARRIEGKSAELQYRTRGRHKDGTTFGIDVHGMRVDYDGRPAVLGLLLDTVVQDTLQAERETLIQTIDAERVLLDRVLNASPAGVALLRAPDFVYELVNPAFQQFGQDRPMLGYRYADVWPEIASEVIPIIEDVIRERKTRQFLDVPFQIRRSSEGPVTSAYFTFSYVPITLPGRPGDYLLVVADETTARKRLEEQFLQAQKMEAVGRLAGGIAHDFNNLLTVIQGYCDLLVTGADPGSPARDDLDEIRKAADRAASLTHQLLAFSRKQMLELKATDLNVVVRENHKMLSRIIGEDVQVALHLAPQLWDVNVDRGQIEQVLMNLAVNARDAMQNGGTLHIETANIDLTAEYAAMHPAVTPGPHVMLAVSDTGSGMTPEVQARLFEPFFTTKEQGKGTGLGLATVFGIVKQSGGAIWVYSEPGQGTTFKLYFPRDEREAVARAAAAPAAPRLTGSETILLVEDDERLRKLAQKILMQGGYAVLSAADPVEALRVCTEHRGTIDLVLTDVMLPRMNGRELADRQGDPTDTPHHVHIRLHGQHHRPPRRLGRRDRFPAEAVHT